MPGAVDTVGMTSEAVKREAIAAGFDLCGIAPAAAFPELAFLREWLDRGYAGEMHYMHRTAERRADVRNVMPGARSVISLGVVYNTDRPYSTQSADPARAALARYAWGDDYHVVIDQRLQTLVERVRAIAGDGFEARAYVDTGPVQERVYAQHAGIGWIGKNTCVINPELGSWIFLAAIICNLPLEPDAPALDQCGTCTLCIDACPTGAIVEPARARLQAMPVVSDHRAERRNPGWASGRDWRTRVRVRRLPGSLSMEPVAVDRQHA
jgi:epoxyqueuosine reductase